ncbi:SAM-dependent methyltransferase [Eupransor demetentiae]|uniref:SAM-dependent methyltransferase n=1 Tax=Eupransor demetentiae TaxID=3109584 RepID=A0ABP0EPJ1_9LACO|nr:hypothetical protein R54876_GBNLAHCA_00749 [Lactobacillaceae bacterium LMG 33000]
MIDQLKEYQVIFSDRPAVQKRIQAVLDCLEALQEQRLPVEPLPALAYSTRQILADPRLMGLDDLLSNLRQYLIEEFGIWFLPNEAWLNDLSAWIAKRPVLEIMAGNALLSAGLRKGGLAVSAVDNFDWAGQDILRPAPCTKVQQADALSAVQNFDKGVVLLAWAPDTTETDAKILDYLRKSQRKIDFIVIGQENGHTNSKLFWQKAQLETIEKLNQHYHSFDGIDDHVFLVK